MLEPPPVFVATDEGATTVLRAARRRRLQQVTAVAGVTVVLAGGSVGFALHRAGNGTDRLSVAEGPAPVRSILPGPASAAPSPPSLPGPTARPVPSASTATTGGGTASHSGGQAGSAAGTVTRRSSGGEAAPSSPPPSTHWSRPDRVSPIWRTRASIPSTDLCQDDTADATAGWCVRFLGPSTARRGHAVTVSAEVCRLGEFNAATIRFTSTREINLSVGRYRTDGRYASDWRAGEGVRYDKPGGSVRVGGGECLVWHSTWDTRDREGFVVPPGTYDVPFHLDSDVGLYGSGQITVTD